MGTYVLINGLQMALAHVVNGTTTDTLNERNGHIRKLLTTLEAHQSVENNINANLSLSQQGRMDTVKKVGTNETASAFKWIRNVIKEKQEKDQRYRTQFFTITSGIDNAVERMPIFIYLWNRFDTLDPNARIKQFLHAAEQDQGVVLSAMLEHPFGAMVNEEVKERALTERAKRLFPRDYENFEQNQIVLEVLVMARNWIGQWLAQEVGVEIPVIRINFGDEIADALSGIPQLAGASK